ncbi:MAG: Hsp33 family molecular chaperone HslO [Treponema sp.]|nr:Hsp33 family molecular chaperone HslO [Candidatus Treponema equifaecale]
MIKAPISDKDLLKHLDSIHKDEMTIFVMADGQFRGAFFNGTRLVNQMRVQHNLGILETMVLGQAMLCGALLVPTMKGREHLTFRYDTNGPAAGFSVEADSTGYVRGYLMQNHIPIDKPLENWDLSPFLGDGTVTISRIGEGMKQAQVGTVEIMYKNIAKDLAWYFDQSEQTHTAFNTSIQFDEKGRVIGAGGMFIQHMPGNGGYAKKENISEEERLHQESVLIQKVENAFTAMPSIGKWFADGGDMEDVIYGLFREFNPSAVLNRDIVFDCPCNMDYYVQHIKHLPKAEVEDIIAHDPEPIEVVCHNCGSSYKIMKDMLK